MTGSSVGTEGFGSWSDDLYRIHAGAAHRVARSITGNPDDAADAVAEAFAGVLEAVAAGRVSGPDGFRPYLLAATRNASIDIVRRKGRLTPTGETGTLDGVVLTGGPSDQLIAGEDRALVAEAFAELPARWRAVLWLTEVEHLAPREAAPLLDLTPNNVAQLAARARGRLRRRYLQMHVRNHAAGDCLEATEMLGGLVAGELTVVQTNRVRGHLAECAECRARLAELDDLGLSLRRAAIPLPAVLYRFRRRWWPWRSRSRAAVPGGPLGDTAAWVSQAGVAPEAATALDLVSSPAVQHLAAAVAAGLLAVGIGAAVVREGEAPPPSRDGQEAMVAPAAASVAVAGPAVEPTTTSTVAGDPTTSTTTPVPAPASGTETRAATTAAFVPRGPLPRAAPSLVAQALVATLPVYDGPGAGTPKLALANPQRSGAPLVLLVTGQQGGWLQVLLPVRPNGSTGWVRADQVSLATHDYRIVVELRAHRITAFQGTDVLLSEPIAVGTADAPTPGGLYYTTELFQPLDRAGHLDAGGPYGPYAYGLSGYSEVLFDFAGGDGQFGIHGTNDPGALGTDVTHGCIRMSNAGITALAGVLPLGVPVEILP